MECEQDEQQMFPEEELKQQQEEEQAEKEQPHIQTKQENIERHVYLQSQQQQQQVSHEQQQEHQLVRKEFQIDFIFKQLYNSLALQAIFGDVFIDLNYDYANSQQFGQPSLLNQYKQVTSVEYFEEMGLVEVNLLSNYTPIYDFQLLSNALCCHQEQHLRELGERLLKYQTIVTLMQQKYQMMKQLIDTSELIENLANSYSQFEVIARKKLLEVHKTNKLFIYSIRQINPYNFGFEVKKYGYSADFLKLLGYNIDQYTNLSIRKGLIELQNFQGRIALNKMTLDLLQGEIVSSVTIKTSYITSDNLELQVDGIVKQHFNIPDASQNSDSNGKPSQFKYTEFLAIVIMDVQTDAMKQIYSIRQQNKLAAAAAALAGQSSPHRDQSEITSPRHKEKSHRIKDSQQTSVFGGPAFMSYLPNNIEIDVDEYYLMETQVLLEKFYDRFSTKRKVKRKKKNLLLQEQNQVLQILQTNEHILTNKICGYRYIKNTPSPNNPN